MTSTEYMACVEKHLNHIKEVVKAKNNDYTAGSDDPFANFKETGGMCDPLVGLLLRMGDKMQRLRTFAKKGKLEVRNEGAEDAFLDLIGYSLIGLGLLEENQKHSHIKTNENGFISSVYTVAGTPKLTSLSYNGRYLRRDGKITGPLADNPYDPKRPFVDIEHGWTYPPSGLFDEKNEPSDLDLIRAVLPHEE